jgi:flagellar motor switch protein FliG
MSGNPADMSGVERAAILLLSLGADEAAQVLKHLDPREVDAVSAQMARLGNVPVERVEAVLGAFRERVQGSGPIPPDGAEYVKKVLSSLFGKQRAELMVERMLVGAGGGSGLEALRWMDPRNIVQIIGDEHPQVIASVLSQLDGRLSAQVLPMLPEKMRTEVLLRIARLEELPQNALSELDQIIGKRAAGGSQASARKVGGARTVADIINAMEREASEGVMTTLENENAELHQKIREMLFVFDDLADVDDRGMQAILREVASENLAVALRGAEPAVSDKIFRNMSKRAAEILKEDMEARGPVKLTEVEAAQREIIAVAQKLAEEGTIIIGKSSNEYV